MVGFSAAYKTLLLLLMCWYVGPYKKKYVNRFKYYLMRGSVFKLINNWGLIIRETTLITHSKSKKNYMLVA